MAEGIDPALVELVERAQEPVAEAIIRLRGPAPPAVRIVSRFGEFATCRLPVQAIHAVHDEEEVASLKAPRPLGPETVLVGSPGTLTRPTDRRRPEDLRTTGRGIVVGLIDFGCDIAHPDFRRADGSTRLLALWDQRRAFADSPRPWRYGRVHTAEAIDAALQRRDPWRALGYHPDPAGQSAGGTHGTHVLSIAGGNGHGGGPPALASDADLAFVHLSRGRTTAVGDLSDSVRVLEAVDFLFRVAGDRPVVVNMSIGAQGGSHDGLTGVELALDAALLERPGRALVQSTGNYFSSRGHAREDLGPGEVWTLEWRIFAGDPTPNELEIWYPGVDVAHVRVLAPDGSLAADAALGQRCDIVVDGARIGRIHHREHDPNNGDHHVDCFLWRGAPHGRWRIQVVALNVVDGRFRAYIERDRSSAPAQSSFEPRNVSAYGTTGTIANGLRTIAVGAVDGHAPAQPIAAFSSAGPTRDGRQKPDLVAPGVDILAARSGGSGGSLLTRKSGTSMASPMVASAVACMFEAAARPLSIAETRWALLGAAAPRSADDRRRVGSGLLDPIVAVEAARELGAQSSPV